MTTYLAVDLGGTSMRAGRTSADGTVTDRQERPTPPEPDAGALVGLCREVLRHGPPVQSAVVGVPGRVDYGAGRLEMAPNLPPGWVDELSESQLSAALDLSVAVANDADLAAVGEAWFGAGRHHRDIAFITISTGIGAGVVTGGLLVHGRRSVAEVGHTIVDGEALVRGEPATVEQLGSGRALDRLAEEAGLPLGGPALVASVREGNEASAAVLARVVAAAAIGAVNVAHLFTPEVLVVGGGLGLNDDLVLDPIRRLLESRGPRGLAGPIEVVGAELGDDAGLAGAGAWSRAFVPEAASRA